MIRRLELNVVSPPILAVCSTCKFPAARFATVVIPRTSRFPLIPTSPRLLNPVIDKLEPEMFERLLMPSTSRFPLIPTSVRLLNPVIAKLAPEILAKVVVPSTSRLPEIPTSVKLLTPLLNKSALDTYPITSRFAPIPTPSKKDEVPYTIKFPISIFPRLLKPSTSRFPEIPTSVRFDRPETERFPAERLDRVVVPEPHKSVSVAEPVVCRDSNPIFPPSESRFTQ